MEKRLNIKNDKYEIPAVLSCPESGSFPAVILCHGTGSNKDEVGNMFKVLAGKLIEKGIASIRFDFAGCGESKARQQDLTFLGEVSDTQRVYEYLRNMPQVAKIGILGFSQGARVMAEFLGTGAEISCAVSWSGACQNGIGIFRRWKGLYYSESCEKGYARIPLDWRDDLLLSKAWFDEISETLPLRTLKRFKGPVLAYAGSEDDMVPCEHAAEIIAASENPESRCVILERAGHTFNVLSNDPSPAKQVLAETADWLNEKLM